MADLAVDLQEWSKLSRLIKIPVVISKCTLNAHFKAGGMPVDITLVSDKQLWKKSETNQSDASTVQEDCNDVVSRTSSVFGLNTRESKVHTCCWHVTEKKGVSLQVTKNWM